jgi:hypothetical protein
MRLKSYLLPVVSLPLMLFLHLEDKVVKIGVDRASPQA